MARTSLNILLIEDNPADVVLLREALARDPWVTFEIRQVERLREGLALWKQQPLDAVLLDLGLPDSQGLATFKLLQTQIPDAPVVVLSGLMDEHLAAGAVRAGAEDYLVKGQTSWDAVPRAVRYAVERRQARTALGESEAWRQLAIAAAGLGTWRNEVAYSRITFDEPARRLFGFASAEQPLEAVLARVHPDDLPRLSRDIAAALDPAGTGRQATEYRLLHPEAGVRWLSVLAGTVFQGLGTGRQAVLALGTVQDITERKRTEQALQESELRYRALFDGSPAAVWEEDFSAVQACFEAWRQAGLTDLAAHLEAHPEEVARLAGLVRVTAANQASLTLLGAGDERAFVRHLPHYFGADSLVIFKQELQALARGEASFHAELPIRNLRGETRLLEIHLVVLPTPAMPLAQVLVAFIDITERRQAEAAIRHETERMQALARLSKSLAVSTADYQIALATVTRALAELIGDCCGIYLLSADDRWLEPAAVYVPDPMAQQTLDALIAGTRFSALTDPFPQLLSADQPLLLPEAILEAVRSQVPASLRAWVERYHPHSVVVIPLRAPGEVIGLLTTARLSAGRTYTAEDAGFVMELADRAAMAIVNARLLAQIQRQNAELEQRVAARTSELSRTNVQLERAARAKDEFLASMSHELRTPLNAILTLAEALEEGIYGTVADRQQRPVHLIAESGQHLLNLINDVLDIAKIEAGMLELQLQPVEVEALCQASLRLIKQQAHKKRLQTSLTLDPAVRSLRADGRRLKQMLVNLLSNAVKFTPEGGQLGLEVRGEPAAGAVHFTVWDTGIGIAPEDAQRLFQPFVQVESGLDRHYEGTGLGLSLVYRMAEMHGGSIALASTPGEGSRFTISLPLEGLNPPAASSPPAAGEPDRPGKVVLVAEDNSGNQALYAGYLASQGYSVRLAGDGLEALQQAAAAPSPDLIVLDMQLPRLDGLEALRRLRANPDTQAVPVIAVTALALAGDRERCLAAGAGAYLPKPVGRRQLLETAAAQWERPAGEESK